MWQRHEPGHADGPGELFLALTDELHCPVEAQQRAFAGNPASRSETRSCVAFIADSGVAHSRCARICARVAAVRGKVAAVKRDQGPVIQEEASEASKTARPRMSSGASEPSGGDAAEPSRGATSGQRPSRLDARIDHLRRQDGIDAHAAAGPFGAELAGHLDHAPMAMLYAMWPRPRAVVLASEPMLTMLPRPGREHPPPRFLAHQETPENQVLEDLSHLLREAALGPAQDPIASDIAQEVDPPEVAVKLDKEALDPRRVGNVNRGREHWAAQRPNLVRRPQAPSESRSTSSKSGAMIGECDGHGATHPARRAGHDRDAALKVETLDRGPDHSLSSPPECDQVTRFGNGSPRRAVAARLAAVSRNDRTARTLADATCDETITLLIARIG